MYQAESEVAPLLFRTIQEKLTSEGTEDAVEKALGTQFVTDQKLPAARQDKLKIVQHNKLIIVQQNKLILGIADGDASGETGPVIGAAPQASVC